MRKVIVTVFAAIMILTGVKAASATLPPSPLYFLSGRIVSMSSDGSSIDVKHTVPGDEEQSSLDVYAITTLHVVGETRQYLRQGRRSLYEGDTIEAQYVTDYHSGRAYLVYLFQQP